MLAPSDLAHLMLPGPTAIAEAELPVVERKTTRRFGPDGTFWKPAEPTQQAAERPWAWLDDDITDNDRRFVENHNDGVALLRYVNPSKRLLDNDFAVLPTWSDANTTPPATDTASVRNNSRGNK
ncbi:hypothetical protein [Nocardia fluminea]|uniref:hypothetical protein n=1 Tax=Nocardia fluminea TaxID=134984 RepID=UPI0033C58A1E